MTNRIPILYPIMLMTGLVIFAPFHHADFAPQKGDATRPLQCTAEALAALKPIPELAYECVGVDDDNRKSPERRAALKEYVQKLETSLTDARWWATPVEDLNVCAMTQEARALTDDERESFSENINLYGDQSTRLVVLVDPCIHYSYSTLNAFILQRVGERVYATQVLDGYYTRIDAAVDMTLAEHKGEKLMMVETHTSDGLMPPTLYTTCSVYTMNPRSHRAVPKKLFKVKGRLTNKFRYDDYLFEDEALEKQWHAPEIIRNGKLAPRFYVYTPVKRRVVRDTYIWNGTYYAPAR
jgi:hypothetical protein